jgi:ribosomal protein S18 acetylase RimI-like enzyme
MTTASPTSEWLVSPLEEEEIAPLARKLSSLPLMVRYERSADKLARALTKALGQPGVEILAARKGKDGPPSGIVWFSHTHGLMVGGYLKLIAVLSRHQNGGLGKKLLCEMERRVAETSHDLFLLVSDFNHSAKRFYERNGYVRAGGLSDLVLEGVTEEIYWKRLTDRAAP